MSQGRWCVGGGNPPIKILVTHTFLNFVIAEDYPRAVRIYKSSVPKTGNRQKPETVKTETIHHIRRKQKEVDCKLYRHLIKRCDRDNKVLRFQNWPKMIGQSKTTYASSPKGDFDAHGYILPGAYKASANSISNSCRALALIG